MTFDRPCSQVGTHVIVIIKLEGNQVKWCRKFDSLAHSIHAACNVYQFRGKYNVVLWCIGGPVIYTAVEANFRLGRA